MELGRVRPGTTVVRREFQGEDRMNRKRKALGALIATAATVGGLSIVALTPAVADVVPGKVSGAIMTTDVNSAAVNKNQYTDKADVYLSGGPNNPNAHFLEVGDYFLAILVPSGQSNPNDGGDGNLSDDVDSAVGRTFHSNGDGTVSALTGLTTHVISAAGVIQAGLPPNYFADTSNPGGVYIAAVCQYVPMSSSDPTPMTVRPQDCKYDAFKVNSTTPPQTEQGAPTAEKTAVPTHDRKVEWSITKTVDGVHSETFTQLGARTLHYSVSVDKTVDYDTFGLTGTITVFNGNVDPMTVDVTEDGLAPAVTGSSCDLDGSGSLIVPGEDTTTLDPGSNSVDYTCTFDSSTPPDLVTFYTNTATVTYDIGNGPQDLPVASDPFNFPAATLSSDSAPETITVTDAFDGGSDIALSPPTASDDYTWTYTRSVFNTYCHQYDNTATITETSQTDSDHVTFCGPNSGGLTMGWWQNKNGQSLLKANLANACSTFNGYLPAVFTHGFGTYLPDAYSSYFGKTTVAQSAYYYNSANCGGPTNVKSYLPTFDMNVFTAANASGTGTWMVEGQWVAAALNTASYPNFTSAGRPTLTATGNIVIPASLQGAGGIGLNACDSIGNLLTATAASYPSYAANKTAITSALITLLTKINQNQALTCSP
jgi:hypothetical protein